ncbi:MAG: class I SAM-dependent RNA methyltransferase [Acidobacteria bacterium]|nr:class I SAM-dependent RNA methyltransferase [Acidobacteriota bacterium]
MILLEAPLALFPGEEVEADLRWKSGHAEGEVRAWKSQDPRRVAPACPVADACGGCSLWGAGASASELKRQMVADLFRRQLGLEDFEWLAAPESAKRARIQLHWDGCALGFHRRRSHDLVPVSVCPAAEPVLSSAIPRLRDALEGRALPCRPGRWELATGTPPGEVHASSEAGGWRLTPAGWTPDDSPLIHRLAGATLRQPAGGFFQVSPAWAAEAFGAVLEAFEVRGETLFDLYGGVGLFSALLRDRFQRFVLVESGETAVEAARMNLADLGLQGECTVSDVAAWLPEGLGSNGDLILLDPPRTGLAPEAIARLLTANAGRMVLVGCDGAAFCRDLKRLEPSWRVEKVAALDLFPMTPHIEAIALLSRH